LVKNLFSPGPLHREAPNNARPFGRLSLADSPLTQARVILFANAMPTSMATTKIPVLVCR
jgi:hypothetical protein